ncbi:MAG: hypothetical protein WCQ64_17465, partial [Acidobacteriota bacterium]
MSRVLVAALLASVTLAAQTSAPRKGSMPVRPHTGPAIVTDFAAAMLTPPPADLGLDPFYKKYADAYGLPIVSSELVPDTTLLMARDIVREGLENRCVAFNSFNYAWDEEWNAGMMASALAGENVEAGVVAL